MGLADLHVHSSHSDGMATVPEILAFAGAETDLDVLAIVDHDQLSGALEAVEWCAGRPSGRLSAVVGTEISASWGRHVVGLFFEEPYPTVPFPRFRSLAETVRRVGDAGGVVVVPHGLSPLVPSVGERAMSHLLDQPHTRSTLLGVEVCSGVAGGRAAESRLRRLNASRWNLSEVGSSDAHHLAQIGAARTAFPGSTPGDLLLALRRRQTSGHWHAAAGEGVRVPVRSHLRQSYRSLIVKPLREARAALAGMRDR